MNLISSLILPLMTSDAQMNFINFSNSVQVMNISVTHEFRGEHIVA
jgi:hypothetical protein